MESRNKCICDQLILIALEAILSMLKEQIGFENEIEKARVRLAYTNDFNLMDFFRIFDVSGSGTILPNDLKNGLETLGFFSDTKDSVFLFTRRYDNDGDGKMKYSDFCDAFTPKERHLASEVHSRSPKNIYEETPIDRYFEPETRALLNQAFKAHFKAELETERLRQSLFKASPLKVSAHFVSFSLTTL